MKKTLSLALACSLMITFSAFAQTGFGGHQIDKNLIFPQFVLGQGFTTQLVLMNPQPGRDLTGTLYFFKQDGTALQVVNNTETVSQITVTIPATGVAFVSVSAVTETDLTIGWALLDITNATGQGSDDPRTRVSGSLIYTNTSNDTTVGKVGVVAGRYELNGHKDAVIPVIVQGTTINTGVAFVNAGADPMTVNFELRDSTGAVVAQQATITPPVSPLAAGNQAARFVTELFPDFNFNQDFKGTLVITTEQEGLVVVGLLTDNLLLTSIPVVYVPPSAGGAQTHTVTNSGFTFDPADLTITAGDSVKWQIADIHDVIEVTEANWTANLNTKKDGGFETDFGGGTLKFDTPGTYFYVCSPHASMGMKGKITVNPAP